MRIPGQISEELGVFESFQFNLLRSAAHAATHDCKGQNQGDHRVAWMPVAKRRMRDVKSNRKDDRERGHWKEVGTMREPEPREACDNSKQRDGVPKKEEAHEQRVCSKEILPRCFCAEPRGDDPAAKELTVERRMSVYKIHGLEPLLMQELSFSDLMV